MATLLALLVPLLSFAAPLLQQGGAYPVNPELKEAAGAAKANWNFRTEAHIDFESLGGGIALKNTTRSGMRLRTAPGEEGKKSEAVFESMEMLSQVPLPGMIKPFINRQDLSPYLSGKSLVVHWKSDRVERLEGVEKLRTRLSTEIRDPVAKMALLMSFTEESLKGNLASAMERAVCLSGIQGKKPGDKWTEGSSSASCRLEGWAEVKGKKVAVVEFALPKRAGESTLPNGKRQNSESESKGRLYWEPVSGESLVFTETQLEVGPAKGEGKAGKASPSQVKAWAHQIPL